MEVITAVEGRVPVSKEEEFETAYASVGAFPPGLIRSSLLRNNNNPEVYRIETVWESREALERMRSSTQTPEAIKLFQKVGVKPQLEIYEVVHSLP